MTDLDELERLLREATVGPVVWRGEYAVQKMMHAINDEEWKLFCALRNAAEELIRDARRYRWLRNEAWGSIGAAPAVCMVDSHGRPCVDDERGADPILEGRELDANIDAAIAQEKP